MIFLLLFLPPLCAFSHLSLQLTHGVLNGSLSNTFWTRWISVIFHTVYPCHCVLNLMNCSCCFNFQIQFWDPFSVEFQVCYLWFAKPTLHPDLLSWLDNYFSLNNNMGCPGSCWQSSNSLIISGQFGLSQWWAWFRFWNRPRAFTGRALCFHWCEDTVMSSRSLIWNVYVKNMSAVTAEMMYALFISVTTVDCYITQHIPRAQSVWKWRWTPTSIQWTSQE